VGAAVPRSEGPLTTAPLPPTQQVALSTRIRGGDAIAEAELAEFFAPRIFLVALSRTHDPDASRDLAQESFLAVLQSLRSGELRDPERLAAFVHGVARNIINNYFRSRMVRAKDAPLEGESAAASLGDPVEAAERSKLIDRALKSLSSVEREVLVLTLVEGFTPAEISARLGLDPAAVRTHKSRGLRKVTERVNRLSQKGHSRHYSA
jgi:RNA polymerase sigma-70 factor, ECF subfamily